MSEPPPGPTEGLTTGAQPGTEPKNFDAVDEAFLPFMLELYRAMHLHTSIAAQTSNRMFQFLAVTTAAFCAVAGRSLAENTTIGVLLSALLFLGLPLTIQIMFLIWLREQLRILRLSVFSLRIERRISQRYSTLSPLFRSKFLDYEGWVRANKLQEREIYSIVTVVFVVIGITSSAVGLALLTIIYEQRCGVLGSSSALPLSLVDDFLAQNRFWSAILPDYIPVDCVYRPAFVIIRFVAYGVTVFSLLILVYTVYRVSDLGRLARAEIKRSALTLDG